MNGKAGDSPSSGVRAISRLRAAKQILRTSASPPRERPQRVDKGLTVVPIADVHANDGFRRMNSAAVGQLRKFVGRNFHVGNGRSRVHNGHGWAPQSPRGIPQSRRATIRAAKKHESLSERPLSNESNQRFRPTAEVHDRPLSGIQLPRNLKCSRDRLLLSADRHEPRAVVVVHAHRLAGHALPGSRKTTTLTHR